MNKNYKINLVGYWNNNLNNPFITFDISKSDGLDLVEIEITKINTVLKEDNQNIKKLERDARKISDSFRKLKNVTK